MGENVSPPCGTRPAKRQVGTPAAEQLLPVAALCFIYRPRGRRRFAVAPTHGHVAEWLRNGLQNRVPRFNSGRGLQINQRVWANAAAPKPASPTRMIGPRIDGEAARKLLVVARSRFQQRCLQTSCWLVQLRLQAPLLPDPAGFASVAAVVGMQAF